MSMSERAQEGLAAVVLLLAVVLVVFAVFWGIDRTMMLAERKCLLQDQDPELLQVLWTEPVPRRVVLVEEVE